MPRRSAALVVVLESGTRLTLRHDVPGKRSECPPAETRMGRCCPHYRCDQHLAFVASPDRPGKRHPGCEIPPTLRYDVLAGQSPSCTLDVIDANPAGLTSREVAKIVGLSTRRVEQIVKRARRDAAARNADEDRDEAASWGGPLYEAQVQAL